MRVKTELPLCACGCGERVRERKSQYKPRCWAKIMKGRAQRAEDPKHQATLALPVMVRCAHCDFSEEVPGHDAAATFAKHREECAALVAA